jgi:TRAP-type transport system periplasmic protein
MRRGARSKCLTLPYVLAFSGENDVPAFDRPSGEDDMREFGMRRAALALGVAAGAWMAAMPVAAQEVTLRVHHFLPPGAPVPANFITPWAEKIEADSDGRIAVEVNAAMSLGGTPPTLIDQVRDGVVDIVWTLAGYTPGRFPKAEVFDLPFIAAGAEPTSRAAWRFYEQHLTDELEGIRPIALHVHGPGVFHMRAPAVETLADLEGRTVRGPTRMITRLLEQLGATPVGMPVPQVPEALSRNVIDGTVIPWEVTLSLRVPELVDTHTEFGGDRSFYTTFFLFAMNPDSYDALPDDLKAVIDDNSGYETSGWVGRVMDEGDAPARAVAVERGTRSSRSRARSWSAGRKAAEPVIAEWIAEMEGRGIDGQQLIDDLTALIEAELEIGARPARRRKGSHDRSVAGAGIGGLTLALSLHQVGHPGAGLRAGRTPGTAGRRHQRPAARGARARRAGPARRRSSGWGSRRRSWPITPSAASASGPRSAAWSPATAGRRSRCIAGGCRCCSSRPRASGWARRPSSPDARWPRSAKARTASPPA